MMKLDQVREDLGDCQRCKLASTRKTIVFGQGDPSAQIMFVGEGPGQEEDLTGEAFVGRAGQYLTTVLGKIGLTREEIYIANIIKCRPPGNRDPEPDEVSSCQPFLEGQINAIRPRVIVALGKYAAHWFTRVDQPISKLRGKVFSYSGIRVLPTYHPAFVLRNPLSENDFVNDLKKAIDVLAKEMTQTELF